MRAPVRPFAYVVVLLITLAALIAGALLSFIALYGWTRQRIRRSHSFSRNFS